jgi:hypothetical protein
MARGIGDIGYVLAKPYWGQGYATEAAAAVLQFGLVPLSLRLIEAQAFPQNLASLRVMAKLGLRYRETRLVTDAPTGATCPVGVCQLAREPWTGDRNGHRGTRLGYKARQSVLCAGFECLTRRFYISFPHHQYRSSRQNYLYVRAELTRPCVCEASGTSNDAPQCHDEAFTREKPTSANSRGDDEPLRSADVRTEVNEIMTRFVSCDTL